MYRGPAPVPGLVPQPGQGLPAVMMPGGVGPQGQMMPPVQYVPVEGDNGPGGVPGAPGGPPGPPTFFMPQHVYLDQNGQPVYYRMPNPNAGPYQQQEMMYAGGPEGGSLKSSSKEEKKYPLTNLIFLVMYVFICNSPVLRLIFTLCLFIRMFVCFFVFYCLYSIFALNWGVVTELN